MDRALVRSELFGHRKGAFTGALDAHAGAFEAARGGTLFLDEVGELPLDIQPILLRALENRAILRVGEAEERRVGVRIVAATNRPLDAEVLERRFREDLFFRLSVVRLRVPPLRERQEDIGPLASSLAAELGLPDVSPALLRELRTRRWRGNVRELKNALEFYGVFGKLPERYSHGDTCSTAAGLTDFANPTRPYLIQKRRLIRRFQTLYFGTLLKMTNGNKAEAARLAGVERSYLCKVIKDLGKIEAECLGDDEAPRR
jgi:DNA-binding NtrC family response regulator